VNCVILQPSYIPWRGYFHQIWKADVFVFYDDVQYDRRGWRNRNKISTDRGPAWLTIPVHAHGSHSGLLSRDVQIAWDTNPEWNADHLRTIQRSYSKAPYFATYAPLLEQELQCADEKLVDLLIRTTTTIARALGITQTRFLRSSELSISGERTERLINIVRSVGADRYISGPSASDYIDDSQFEGAGIELEYMKYEYPEYPQLRTPFDPQLSIIDLLMMVGSQASKYIWEE
jgi:hypothetical protein